MAEEHNLVLILARGLASSMATPVFLVDPDGRLVYYNEPAEAILGRTYAEAGALTQEEWGTMFRPHDPDSGADLNLKSLPLSVALHERKPAHAPMSIMGMDSVPRTIAVTALPLFAKEDEFIGAMAVFWEDRA
ncbi:MAG TPA: PAS domain-containing protein [Actinomycetota bacterium]|nr:PAS domain-containing protein [Actinomycetota bacterium]